MLEPQDRHLLFDLLRPPLGYQLDYAISTTFSLDLMTLMTVPLAFTLFDMQDKNERPTADPNGLLEAIRRCADRMTIFCQAGRVAIPRNRQLLLGYLERTVYQVTAPRGGVFHPKCSVLRFELNTKDDDRDPDAAPVMYRFICASRNLTFDRSWDTALTLEGRLTKRASGFRENQPLSEFVRALPSLGPDALPEDRIQKVRAVAEELLRVEFEIPDTFFDVEFCPIGIGKTSTWPLGDEFFDRMLVISPFLADSVLGRLAQSASKTTLVSRFESLEELKLATLRKMDNSWVLAPEAEALDPSSEPVAGEQDTPPTPPPEPVAEEDDLVDMDCESELSGLHAKLFIADLGDETHLWTGSANATDAAFEKNVEFLVKLVGRKKDVGVEALLARGKEGSKRGREATLGDLLEPYARKQDPRLPDQVQQQLDRLVEQARCALALGGMAAVANRLPGEPELYRVDLQSANTPTQPAGVSTKCWPITIRETLAAQGGCGGTGTYATFPSLTFPALTAFFAFEVSAVAGDRRAVARFVLRLPTQGFPADREHRLLLAMLSNKTRVLRYLLMLLASDEWSVRQTLDIIRKQIGKGGRGANGHFSGLPLLEPMLRALHRDPTKLDAINRLVEDLRKTEGGRERLPGDFDDVWQPIWQARGNIQ
jgi:hypothetical protein